MATVIRLSEIPSQRVERYELLAELASGGMATVYLARLGGAGGFQRLYAIKRLHPHLAREQEFVEMFLDEARLAARIHHPNVVPILEVGQSETGYFLVMEYIEGETLARLLGRMASRSGRIPLRIGAKIVLDTLAGLETAHGLRDDFGTPLTIVHRDVSPQNVMVGVDGTARITDFGVARAATRLSTTRVGQLKGKLGYMAPEQARGDDIDLRADVFGVGVILWETIAGRRLFRGKPDAPEAQILNRLLYDPIPKLRDVEPGVAQVLEDVCSRALERDPDKRFPSCNVFAETLEATMFQCGGIASVREVAAFVDEIAGPEIEQQREAVRSWVTRSDVSVIERPSGQTEFTPPVSSSLTSPFALGLPVPSPNQLEERTEPASIVSRRSNTLLLFGGAAMLILAATIAVATVYMLRDRSFPASPNGSALPGVSSPAISFDADAPSSASVQPILSALPALDDAQPPATGAPTHRERPPREPSVKPKTDKTDKVDKPDKADTSPPKLPSEPFDDLTNPYRH